MVDQFFQLYQISIFKIANFSTIQDVKFKNTNLSVLGGALFFTGTLENQINIENTKFNLNNASFGGIVYLQKLNV